MAQVLSTITYFLLIAWKARVAKRKVVELKAVVSTYDQASAMASAEVVSKFRADAFKARGFWHLEAHIALLQLACKEALSLVHLRGCGTGTQVDR